MTGKEVEAESMSNIVKVEVLADVKNIKHGIDDVNGKLGKLNKSVGGASKLMKGAFAFAAAGAVTDFLGDAIKNAEDAAAAGRVLSNTFNSMGGAGSQAFKNAADQATKLGESIGVDDDEISRVQTKLATFGKVWEDPIRGSEMFGRATQSAYDLAAAGFGSAEGNAVALGKALQDPSKGITALAKSGVTFTEAEKEKIKALQKSGHLLEAQNIIMKAVETQTKGAAAANVTSSKKMSVAMGELTEKIGTVLLPIFEKITALMITTIVPAFQSFMDGLSGVKTNADGLGGAMNIVGGILNTVGTFVSQNLEFFKIFGTILVVLIAATYAWSVAMAIFNAVMYANPVVLIGIAIAALIAIVVMAYLKFDTFRKVVDTAWQVIQKVFQVAWSIIKVIIGAYIAWIMLLIGAVKKIWEIVSDVFGKVVGFIKSAVDTIKGLIGRLLEYFGIKDKVLGLFNGAANWLIDAGKNIISGLWSGIQGMGSWLMDKITGFIKDNVPDAVASILGINSPSKVFADIGKNVVLGLAGGLGDTTSVDLATTNLANSVGSNFSPTINSPRGSGGSTYNITINSLDSSSEIGRKVVASIKDYERTSGNGWRR